MTINIALLGFGTVASGIPFLLKENGEKITAQAGTEIQIAKVLVRDGDNGKRVKFSTFLLSPAPVSIKM